MAEPDKFPNPSHADAVAVRRGIPAFPDGPPDWPGFDPEVQTALERAVADGTWGIYHGPHCAAFKEAFAALHEVEHIELCASGTAAVELALRGVRVGSGDEVILAAYDFKANFQNVIALDATPVLVDVRADDWQMDVELLDAALTAKTKAVIASHLHGGLVRMPQLTVWAAEHGVVVIEDACQCPGAMIEGRRASTWGDVGVHSFGGSKLLTSGRGGAVATNDASIMQRIKLYSARGNDAYPLSELQAAVLLPQLGRLDESNRIRATAVETLESVFVNAGLNPLATHGAGLSPAFYKLGLQYDASRFGGLTRDEFVTSIQSEGLAISSGFRSLHRIHSRRRFRASGELPIADQVDDNVLTLHHPILLQTDDQTVQRVQEALTRVASI